MQTIKLPTDFDGCGHKSLSLLRYSDIYLSKEGLTLSMGTQHSLTSVLSVSVAIRSRCQVAYGEDRHVQKVQHIPGQRQRQSTYVPTSD